MTIRAYVVDDMAFFRKMFSDAVNALPGFETVATSPSGEIALEKLKLQPADVVFLDVYMPGINGLETLLEIRKHFPETTVIMISAVASREAEIVVKALSRGALEFIQKPAESTFEANVKALQMEMENVAEIIKSRIAPKATATKRITRPITRPVSGTKATPPKLQSFAAMVIGVSTGGPDALGKLIPQLPADFPLPILVVQHMPPMFTASLAKVLNTNSPIEVSEAVNGETIEKSRVLIAPGGKHMTIKRFLGREVVELTDDAPENSCRPAADVLFRSVADVYGRQGVLALILTGMGSDGALGVKALKNKNCLCVSQSERSSLIYGMPRAVDEAGLSDISVDLEAIPQYLATITAKNKVLH